MSLITFILVVFALRYVEAQAFTQQICLTQYTSASGRPESTTTIAQTISIPEKVVVTITPSTVLTPSATTSESRDNPSFSSDCLSNSLGSHPSSFSLEITIVPSSSTAACLPAIYYC